MGIPSTKQFLEECGVTSNSLHNAKIYIDAWGIPNKVILNYIEDPWDYIVALEWNEDTKIEFNGFSWGYRGEGPRGLAELMSWIVGDDGFNEDIYTMKREQKHFVLFEESD